MQKIKLSTMRRSVTGMLILALTGSVSELPVWAVCMIHLVILRSRMKIIKWK